MNLFRDQHRDELRKERRDLYGMRAAALMLMAANVRKQDSPEFAEHQAKFHALEKRIHQVESELLLIAAFYLGIEYPTKEEKSDWWDSDETESWLSEKGQIHLNKLVKEERRKNVEWWVKTLIPILGSIISLFGLFIALLTILHTLGRI